MIMKDLIGKHQKYSYSEALCSLSEQILRNGLGVL